MAAHAGLKAWLCGALRSRSTRSSGEGFWPRSRLAIHFPKPDRQHLGHDGGPVVELPPWQPRICSRTPMGYSDPHQCSLGAAACYLLYMLTRAILMPSLFHRLFQKQALARGHCRGRVGDDSLAFFGAEFETNRKVDLPRGNV